MSEKDKSSGTDFPPPPNGPPNNPPNNPPFSVPDYFSGSYDRDTASRVGESLSRLSQTEPSNVQKVAASQIEILATYHNDALTQARISFYVALIAAIVGLVFFIAAVSFILFQGAQDIAIISAIGGTLIEVIAGINFVLYGKTSNQVGDFQNRLERTQRFLLANSICEGLEGDYKQEARSKLVQTIASTELQAGELIPEEE